jgi:hypothetical protein
LTLTPFLGSTPGRTWTGDLIVLPRRRLKNAGAPDSLTRLRHVKLRGGCRAPAFCRYILHKERDRISEAWVPCKNPETPMSAI